MDRVLVTGAAGFIGFHLCRKLAEEGFDVVGLDNLNDYYDPALKYGRLRELGISTPENLPYNEPAPGIANFRFYRLNLHDTENITALFSTEGFRYVVSLGAQAGVRYSLRNPHSYVESNVLGFLNILEGCRHNQVAHLIFASSSSVYGLNETIPFSVGQNVDHPISLYAATKKANELMAHSYAHLYGIPCSGLRFFTVYGPWGRPDMAPFIFTKNILAGKEIDVFNHGDMQRDFTYVDDIVESIYRLLPVKPGPSETFTGSAPDPSISSAPYRLYNIGNNAPVKLMDFIHAIEEVTGKKARLNFMDMQPGDVPVTFADVNSLFEATSFRPKTTVLEGMQRFVEWYKEFYPELVTSD